LFFADIHTDITRPGSKNSVHGSPGLEGRRGPNPSRGLLADCPRRLVRRSCRAGRLFCDRGAGSRALEARTSFALCWSRSQKNLEANRVVKFITCSRNQSDPGRFLTFKSWTDKAALEVHMTIRISRSSSRSSTCSGEAFHAALHERADRRMGRAVKR